MESHSLTTFGTGGMRKLVFLPIFLILFSPVGALSPMHSYQDLVAGEGTAGFKDGPFYSALFHAPQELAVSPDGLKLYVADRDNNRIRVVNLERDNQVSTLAGTGEGGFKDGPLGLAQFYHPTGLLALPNGNLVINDLGNARIRLVDFKQKTVSTLAGNGETGDRDGKGNQAQTGNIRSMAYLASQESVYFSQPETGSLRKLDLKTHDVSLVFKNKPEIPNPGALCTARGKIYAADLNQDQVYELSPGPSSGGGESPSFTWQAFAKGEKIQSMAWAGSIQIGRAHV